MKLHLLDGKNIKKILAYFVGKSFPEEIWIRVLKFLENASNIETVIVDEAHRYRNSSTETYDKLKNICRGRKVILLTAHCFNNTPEDILSLLSLLLFPEI